MTKLAFISFVGSVAVFSTIPTLLLANELTIYSLINIGSICLGFFFSNIVRFRSVKMPSFTRYQVLSLLLVFVLIEARLGFKNIVALNAAAVELYLDETNYSSAKSILMIFQEAVRILLFIAVCSFAEKSRFNAALVNTMVTLISSGISRAQITIGMLFSYLMLVRGRIHITSVISALILMYGVFSIASNMRGDDANAALGSSLFTAVGYPTLNFYYLSEKEPLFNELNLINQILIKPFPNFIFELFGESKDILSYNLLLTELTTGKQVSADQPISVFTSASIYYSFGNPYIICLITSVLYFFIFTFINIFREYRLYMFYFIFFCCLSHRSTILDVMSFLILNLYVFVFLKILLLASRKSL